MTAKTHMIAGAIAGEVVAVLAFMNAPEAALVCAGTSVLGSLLPDLDAVGSKISMTNEKTLIASLIVSLFSKHRGPLHTPFVGLLFSVFLYILCYLCGTFPLPVALGVFTGILSHLILDSMNPAGIMWNWPFRKRRKRFAYIQPNSVKEIILMVVLIAVLGITTIYFKAFYPNLKW